MLGISINGEFLDLSPGTTAQIERTSPFFNSDDLAEEYSLPFTIPYTPKNARLLGFPNHYYTRRFKNKIPAKLYDNNNFAYGGMLVVESAGLNVNDVTQTHIGGYFLSGVSSFFQEVKNKKLKELYLDGVRNFIWTNNDPASPNIGFWQVIHKAMDGSREYLFAPIRNSMWSGTDDAGSPDMMNKIGEDGNLDYASNYSTLAPQISLKYLLTKIFEEHDWAFDYSEMNDAAWETIYMPSFYAVTWQKVVKLPNDPWFQYSPLPNISMNLQNHVPPEEYIQNFIIGLRNRYNWGFDFDSVTKTCSMFPLKNLANGVKKDWTKFMAEQLDSSFSEDEKIFAFKNEIDSNDGLSSSPDFTKVQYGNPVDSYSDLPAPVEDNFNQVIFVWKDNKFYQNRYNDTTHDYEWQLFADNIYDFEPDGHNEDISTDISTMPVYKTLFRNNGASDLFILLPLCEQEGNWEGKDGEFKPWGVRLLFYRGKVFEGNPLGNAGTVKYPYLTSICFTITQTEPDLDWSNVFVHQSPDGVNKGIIDYWWKETLEFRKNSEVNTVALYLPRTELANFKWSDVILLKNIPYVAQKITEVIPYDSSVKADLRRIG